MKKFLAGLAVAGILLSGCYTPPPIPDNIAPDKIEAAKKKALAEEEKIKAAEDKVEEKKAEIQKKEEELEAKKEEKKKVDDVLDKLNKGEI